MSVPSFEPGVWPGHASRPVLRVLPGGRAGDPRVAKPSDGVRLTRRGRAVLGLLAVLVAAAVVGLTAARMGMADTGPAPATQRIVVAPGDTLWSIATAVAPEADRRSTVEAIITVNHLHGAHIEPGQQLVVPARS